MRQGVTLTIPFYNEEAILERTLSEVWRFLSELERPFEFILGDDGSTDGSAKLAEAFAHAHPEHCRLIRNPANRGKGSVLSRAFHEAVMPVVIYVDADLEIGLPDVKKLISRFDDPRIQVCTGSKLLTPQPKLRAKHRKLASIVYNVLVRAFFGSTLSDHQCGLKGFRREALAALLPDVREEGWAWDTEILLLARKKNLRVDEFPVELRVRRESTVPFFPTVALLLKKIAAFRRRGLAL